MESIIQRRVIVFTCFLLCLVISNLGQIDPESGRDWEDPALDVADSGDEDAEDYGEEGDGDEYEIKDGDNPMLNSGNRYEEEEEEEEEKEDEGGKASDYDERDVVVLGSSNFTKFVTKEQYVFVEFYAPWCRHCKSLAPEWSATATALKHQVPVAKVDVTVHTDISEQLHLSSYPSLFFFVHGVHSSYNGIRSKDAFLEYVNGKMNRTVRALMSISDAETLLEVNTPISVAYLKKLKNPEVFELTTVAKQLDGVEFYMTSNEDVAAMFGLEAKVKPVLLLLKNVPDKRVVYKGTFKRNLLHEFVSTNKLPLVIFFSQKTISLIMENEIKKQVLCFVQDEEYWGYAQPLFEEVARAFKGQAVFIRVVLDSSEGLKAAEYFGVTGENPIVIMAFSTAEDGLKYLHQGEFTVEGIKKFVEGFTKNNLRPYHKSERIPDHNDEAVRIAVGRNFEEIVLDETKDILVELYAPWCHYCQELESTFYRLAHRLMSIPSISIVKMNMEANEHPLAKVDGYPTILFFPAGKKNTKPITFHGDRTVKGLYQFLKKNAAIPFALPESKRSRAPNKVKQDPNDEL